jgi:glycosyltransferase involved in cell wall biosynthesis
MSNKVKRIIKESIKAAVNPRRAKENLVVAKKRRDSNRIRRQDYIKWFRQQTLTEDQLEVQKNEAAKLDNQPLFSILLPTYNTDPIHLAECIESVIAQTYTNWEICISDDASPNEETKDIIKKYTEKYSNINAVFNKTNQHIAGSSNIALGMAKGEYISLLDHDDLLLPNALYETALMINQNPDADLVYTDEDKLEDDTYHVEPFFKPDWSPDFLNSCNYITHFATLSSKIMKEVNGFTPGTQGAQDWDLFLRVTNKTNKIYHIPKILYTWRKSATSTAQSANSKPYAYINQKKVLRNSVANRQLNASVEAHAALGFWRVKYGIEGTPLVSIIIPSKDSYKYITQCIDSIIENTTYAYFEIVIVDTGSTDTKVLDYYTKVSDNNVQVRVVNWNKKPFNFSEACNFGAKQAKGEYFLFLNNDTEIISHDWIQGMLEHAQRPQNGMIGAKLLFPNETVQHAGVVLSEKDIAFHPFYGQNPLIDIFNYIYVANIRNVSAVTAACSMVSKEKFNSVGGFDVKLRVTYNDVDLCLKLLERGFSNVYTPAVELFHYESISVGRIETDDRDQVELREAQNIMKKRWSKYLKRDAYYNDNFLQHGPGYKL